MKIKKVLYAIHKSFLCSGADKQSLLTGPAVRAATAQPPQCTVRTLSTSSSHRRRCHLSYESLQSQQLQYRTWIERTSTHVDKKEQATDDRQCLEEIVPRDAIKDNKEEGGS